MRNLIGDKSSFGIEYEIVPSNPRLGYMRLWLEGKYIGEIEDIHVLSASLYQLEIDPTSIEGCQFINESPEKIYELMCLTSTTDTYKYVCSPGEAFDDFRIYWYTCNGKLYFVWGLVDEPFFEYPGYPRGVQSAMVPVDEFQRIVAEVTKIIDIARTKVKLLIK